MGRGVCAALAEVMTSRRHGGRSHVDEAAGVAPPTADSMTLLLLLAFIWTSHKDGSVTGELRDSVVM